MKIITPNSLKTQRAKYFEIVDIQVNFGWNNYMDIIFYDAIADSYDLGNLEKVSFYSQEEITFEDLIHGLKQVSIRFKEKKGFNKRYNSQKWLFRNLMIQFSKKIFQPTPSLQKLKLWEKELDII